VVADQAWLDPHVHAEAGIVDRGRIRAVLTQVVGRAPVLPATVTTACGERRPVAMTSVLPERVTCLACREAARDSHLRAARQLEAMGSLPAVGTEDLRRLRQRALEHRDLARRFG
jgi:hypothetical protein